MFWVIGILAILGGPIVWALLRGRGAPPTDDALGLSGTSTYVQRSEERSSFFPPGGPPLSGS